MAASLTLSKPQATGALPMPSEAKQMPALKSMPRDVPDKKQRLTVPTGSVAPRCSPATAQVPVELGDAKKADQTSMGSRLTQAKKRDMDHAFVHVVTWQEFKPHLDWCEAEIHKMIDTKNSKFADVEHTRVKEEFVRYRAVVDTPEEPFDDSYGMLGVNDGYEDVYAAALTKIMVARSGGIDLLGGDVVQMQFVSYRCFGAFFWSKTDQKVIPPVDDPLSDYYNLPAEFKVPVYPPNWWDQTGFGGYSASGALNYDLKQFPINGDKTVMLTGKSKKDGSGKLEKLDSVLASTIGMLRERKDAEALENAKALEIHRVEMKELRGLIHQMGTTVDMFAKFRKNGDKTVKMKQTYTEPDNADFDGDEDEGPHASITQFLIEGEPCYFVLISEEEESDVVKFDEQLPFFADGRVHSIDRIGNFFDDEEWAELLKPTGFKDVTPTNTFVYVF